LSIFWIITFIIIAIYYLYVAYVLLYKKKKKKNDEKNDSYSQIKHKFVNESHNEQTDLETILNQVSEAETNSKLLEVFKEGSKSDKINNSLNSQKNEPFKVIRNEKSAEEKDSDSRT